MVSDYKIQGIVFQKNAYLKVKIANVYCAFMDEFQVTKRLTIKAYLTQNRNAPFVLGFDDFLSRSQLVINAEKEKGYVEIKES